MAIPSPMKVNVQKLYVDSLKLFSPLRRGLEFKYFRAAQGLFDNLSVTLTYIILTLWKFKSFLDLVFPI